MIANIQAAAVIAKAVFQVHVAMRSAPWNQEMARRTPYLAGMTALLVLDKLCAPIKGENISSYRLAMDDAPSTPSQSRRTAQLENRAAKMENLTCQSFSILTNLHPMSPESVLEDPHRTSLDTSVRRKEAEESETIILRGSSFKTQYYGSTNDAAHIIHFPEFFRFAKDPTGDRSIMMRIRADMGELK